nr:lipoprotein [Streptomyces clavuligerus]
MTFPDAGVLGGPEDRQHRPLPGGPPQQGTVRLVCEIRRQTRWNGGVSLRVWQARATTPDRTGALPHRGPRRGEPVPHRDPGNAAEGRRGGHGHEGRKLDASEVTLRQRRPRPRRAQKERALAVAAPRGTVVVLDLGGMDTAEHERMLSRPSDSPWRPLRARRRAPRSQEGTGRCCE